MSCASCVGRVEAALAKVEGVDGVSVNLATERADIRPAGPVDRLALVQAVEKASRESDLGLNPQTEGQVLRIRIPELNEKRRQDMVKVAHKYAEEAKIAVRHVRRDGIDLIKKLEKDGHLPKDDVAKQSDQVQKATDKHIGEIDQALASKEKEILHV